MSYWKNRSGNANNIWSYQADGSWLAWEVSEERGETDHGAKEEVEERLLSSLNATNLIVLIGSGASFAATNTNKKALQAPSMGELWDYAREKVGEEEFDKVASAVGPNLQKDKDIEALLSLCKMTVEVTAAKKHKEATGSECIPDPDLEPFLRKAERAILDRVDFVSGETDLSSHKEFLRRLARRSPDKPRVKLFTTNYDRCIEEAAVAHNLVLIDGFSHSAVQRFNRDHFLHDIVRRSPIGTRADYVYGVLHLYKLHGSMDWRRKQDGVVIRNMDVDKNLEPVLIYPRSSKYQEAFLPPYLDMFAAWQAALREPDTTLIVSGFGFADDHISAPIWSALESNLSIRIVLCDPCFIPESELAGDDVQNKINGNEKNNDRLKPYLKRILKLVTEGDSRVTVLNGRFSDLANALPDIVGETDRQRLESMLERIRGQEDAKG